MGVAVCGGRPKYFPLYTSTLFLLRVSQNGEKTKGIRVFFNSINLSTEKSIYHIPIAVLGMC